MLFIFSWYNNKQLIKGRIKIALKEDIIKLEELLKSVITKKDLDHGEQSELMDFIEDEDSKNVEDDVM